MVMDPFFFSFFFFFLGGGDCFVCTRKESRLLLLSIPGAGKYALLSPFVCLYL